MESFIERYQKKLYRLLVMPSVNRRHVRIPALFESVAPLDPSKLFVIVIAFNDYELVALHHDALKKFLKDDFEYIVADNSNDDAEAEKIKKYCLEHHMNYLRLPKVDGWKGLSQKTGWGGVSHGFALNWAYRNIVQKFKPERYGFWDYDLLPVHPMSIDAHLDKGKVWGIGIKRRPHLRPFRYPLYFWPGFAFFRRDTFRRAPNFLPEIGVDTGGGVGFGPEILTANPDIPEFYEAPLIDIAPDTKVWDYMHLMVHFGGSSNGPSDALSIKKRWMEKVLRS